MTVRWKPLLILSGLFVVVALVGLMTIATVMGSRGPADIIARARVEKKAREYDKAKLDYQRALKLDGRNAALHEEVADLYEEWLGQAPTEKKAELRGLFLAALNSSAKVGTKRPSPRRRMLAEAFRQDDTVEQAHWAKDLLTLEPDNGDAHFVMAADGLDAGSPNLPEIRRHLKALDAETPRRPRTEWVAARVASLARDETGLTRILERSRALTPSADVHPTDRMALLRLRVLDVQNTRDTAALASRVDAVTRDALAAASEPDIPSPRIARVSQLIEVVQTGLVNLGVDTPSARDRLKAYGDTLDQVAETIFQKSLDVKGGPDLGVYLTYADHLRFRDRRERCLSVALEGLKSPAGTKQAASETSLGLHALAVEASLANLGDKARYDAAAPHIKALLDGKFERFQALGHLFQGAIDLERAGMVADAQAPEMPKTEQTKLRVSALGHLRIAAGQLPNLAEAQARYGVALILNQEPAMGRQFLQHAQRLGNLEPQYQIWAAWSVVQAGYPEDAEPIVVRLLEMIAQGKLPRTLEGTLHLLNGEIYQARKSPSDLKKAIEEYRRAFANGEDATPAVELRLAQIEVMLGRPADALKRLDWLASKGKAGPAAENLAVLTLVELKRDADARTRLDRARSSYPDSGELAVLDASIRVKGKQAPEADRILAEFLVRVPDNAAAAQQRAQILADELDQPAEAHKLLASIADRAENSGPLVQLALLDVKLKNYEAAAASIARVRQRWKDAAAGDLLDAQLALARGDGRTASGFFDAALKKDPSNKLVQYYKAQLDGRSDPEGSAKVFQALANEPSMKEVGGGLSLTAASQTALAGIALESGDLDAAILRYREMLKDGSAASISRAIRWQLVAAQAAKKEWPAVKAELDLLLNDPKTTPTPEERVRGATYYRVHGDDKTALSLADTVLKDDPSYPGAVVTRAEILSRTEKHAEARATIRQAIDGSTASGRKAPAVLYLMLAAVESKAPPADQGFTRALTVLDQGLDQVPDSTELVQAKCRVLILTQGPKVGLAFVEGVAKANPSGFRRLLLATYRDQGDYASAERVAAEMARDEPNDVAVEVTRINMAAAQAVEAARKGDLASARRLDDKTAALIHDGRTRFKGDANFTQLECELEIRRGDSTRALALSQEVDVQAKTSAAGPLLRGRIYSLKNQPREAAAAYSEALTRNPRLPEARLQLARLSLKTGQVDEAIRQARFLQDADPDQPTGMAALLIEARALAIQSGTAAQVQANRTRALDRLAAALRERPAFAEASHLLAEIALLGGDRTRAVATLKAALKANPDDFPALARVVQYLAEARGKGKPAPRVDLDDARALASASGDADARGERTLAIANGYTRANQGELALPWAEKAAARLNSTSARLALGDLLLTLSEAQGDPTRARQFQDRAVAEYDIVLATQPNSVDAVNNKAWILHSYLGQSQAALELARGLLQKVDPNSLPGEFFDTLGSIQEDLGQAKDAEESYRKGLNKAPEHPVLNYHMGRLMLADKTRSRKAGDYLKVAEAARDRLPAPLADKLNSLLQQSATN